MRNVYVRAGAAAAGLITLAVVVGAPFKWR